MKRAIPFILSVILFLSFGVQIQAAELPFIPDGEEINSEVKETAADNILSAADSGMVTEKYSEVTTGNDNNTIITGAGEKGTVTCNTQIFPEPVSETRQAAVSGAGNEYVSVSDGEISVSADTSRNIVTADTDRNVTAETTESITETAESIAETSSETAREKTEGGENSGTVFIFAGIAAALILSVTAAIIVKRKKQRP